MYDSGMARITSANVVDMIGSVSAACSHLNCGYYHAGGDIIAIYDEAEKHARDTGHVVSFTARFTFNHTKELP